MKQRINITIEEEILKIADKKALERNINRSELISEAIVKVPTYDFAEESRKVERPRVFYNEENMAIVLKAFPRFKDVQHFFNSVVIQWAAKAVEAVNRGVSTLDSVPKGFVKTAKFGLIDEKTAKLLENSEGQDLKITDGDFTQDGGKAEQEVRYDTDEV